MIDSRGNPQGAVVEDVHRHFCERQANLLLKLAHQSTHTELRENLIAMARGWTVMIADVQSSGGSVLPSPVHGATHHSPLPVACGDWCNC